MINVRSSNLWTSEEISQVLNIRSQNCWEATGVSIDSRSINPRDIFVALEGQNFDGHDFVSEAFEKQASVALVSRKYNNLLKPTILVPDIPAAMDKIARFSRSRGKAQIIGVTGSVGKTSTKEMLRLVLSEHGMVAATEGNLNNHIGLPLSLMRMHKSTKFGVFEMGMSSPGEIQRLSCIVKPNIGIITSVDYAHSQFFNTIYDIANAKAEIACGMDRTGTVVLDYDSDLFDHIRMRIIEWGVQNIRTFGFEKGADYRILKVSQSQNGIIVYSDLAGKLVDFKIDMHGAHWAVNAVAVLAATDIVGVDIYKVAKKLGEVTPIKGRCQTQKIATPDGNFILIDDSYNANPASMRAAIEVLGSFPVSNKGRRIAVLGDMLELGKDAKSSHEALFEMLYKKRIDLVFSTGKNMKSLWSSLPTSMQGGWASSAEELSYLVKSNLGTDDVIMVKGSHGSNVWKVVSDLKK